MGRSRVEIKSGVLLFLQDEPCNGDSTFTSSRYGRVIARAELARQQGVPGEIGWHSHGEHKHYRLGWNPAREAHPRADHPRLRDRRAKRLPASNAGAKQERCEARLYRSVGARQVRERYYAFIRTFDVRQPKRLEVPVD